jgi:uncharacterized double-CXXCG motif protein
VKFFQVRRDETSRHTGDINAAHKWGLPGIHCPTCDTTWSSTGHFYPSVDLSSLPEQSKFTKPRLEKDFSEFQRLCELVRPLLPAGTHLYPGMMFGPLVGTASGSFGSLFFQNPWTLLARRDTVEQLQAAGIPGLKACHHELRFRQKDPPDLLEFQIEPHGQLHADCIPAEKRVPCSTCGRYGFSKPAEPVLEALSLPKHLPLFRLANFPTLIICSESFADAVRSTGLDGAVFHDLPLR